MFRDPQYSSPSRLNLRTVHRTPYALPASRSFPLPLTIRARFFLHPDPAENDYLLANENTDKKTDRGLFRELTPNGSTFSA
ncbi:hypothetical protein HYPSUDRAFT_34823 [Hypholoma sublateritium FD-334 SS-4]|uniref:Uncharacterized protein n=1 Tax=Hypholoma sublateritium (strain FD-334 SS-4) TaxID=945553 RepID=A0A0D2PA04_HYPSF|nr:hypothetical protein HYPSUDRAFT_34823 [Hypholoma sublateritium FD-334 SS-4]